MMLQPFSVMLMAVAIVLSGTMRCQALRADLHLLERYLQALEQLAHAIRFQHMPLPQALRLAAGKEDDALQRYFFQAADYAASPDKAQTVAAPAVLSGLELPLQLMGAGLDLEGQLGLLQRLSADVEREKIRQEAETARRCRTALSLSLSLAAVCAIVLC